ncbi:Transcriptional regulator RPN4 [Pichia kudriavzevii]|uniref:Transcriptional regulator RPN4 n=1 Tax=Pichia kudriavzevii TaxID=4909 RepID=A0A1V2LPP9_PICKU|nr:Transcriptional regulator RPN4 [Pichia kudriavzevii]
MATTLSRTNTEVMDDYLPLTTQITNQSDISQVQAQSIQPNQSSQQHSSQNDFYQYISLPNMSQDSLQKFSENEEPINPISEAAAPALTRNTNNNNMSNGNDVHDITNRSNFGNIYNPYASMDSYTVPLTADPLNPEIMNLTTDESNYNNEDIQIVNPRQTTTNPTPSNFNNSINQNINQSEKIEYDDDILMVPQDNYFVYDQQDTQNIPELMELELQNKHNNYGYDNLNSIYSLTVPNQLNSISANQNGISVSGISSPLTSFEDVDLYATDDTKDSSTNNVSNSFNVTDDELHQIHNHNTFNMRHFDDYEEEEANEREIHDHDDDEEDEEGEFYDDEYAIDIDMDSDLHTPVFKDRKESVTAESRPFLRKERRSSSLRTSSRPKRLSRKSAFASLMPHQAPSLRKPRVSSHSHSENCRVEYDENKNEEHICTIPNPKTGKPCLKKFSRPYDLVRHQNTIHASKRSFYRCMFCEDDLRRKHGLDSINEVVIACKYRDTQFSIDNSQSHTASSHNVKKVKTGTVNNSGYLSNKTFSRCDALTRHLRFRHGLNNNQLVDAMDFAKKNVEYYDN